MKVTDEGRAFQTVGAARLKALSARIVLEEGTVVNSTINKQVSKIIHVCPFLSSSSSFIMPNGSR